MIGDRDRILSPSAMSAARFRLRLLALVAVVVTALAFGAGSASGADAEQRAGVVVQLPDGSVKTAAITFSAESITGIQALELAGFAPATFGFGGTNPAVCAICGEGCPADGSCLTCGGSEYWSYWRAPNGSSGWSYSPAGAGSVQVTDGDVEGWRWGDGSQAPPAVSFADIWGEPAPPAATTSPPAPAPTSPPSTSSPIPTIGAAVPDTGASDAAPDDPQSPAAPDAATPPPAAPASTDVVGDATPASDAAVGPGSDSGTGPSTTQSAPTSRPPRSTTTDQSAARASDSSTPTTVPAGVAAPVASDDTDGGRGSALGIVSFAAIVAVIVGWLAYGRRRRRTPIDGEAA